MSVYNLKPKVRTHEWISADLYPTVEVTKYRNKTYNWSF